MLPSAVVLAMVAAVMPLAAATALAAGRAAAFGSTASQLSAGYCSRELRQQVPLVTNAICSPAPGPLTAVPTYTGTDTSSGCCGCCCCCC